MKAAGELLSRPAAYRAAIATADVALAHLPRWVIYNGLNAWGRHREVPHPPKGCWTTAEIRTSYDAYRTFAAIPRA
jgi:hypothetical protein